MKTTTQSQAAIFVDEVDYVLEFRDVAGRVEKATGGVPNSKSAPIFSDEVDRVLEVSDTPAKETTHHLAEQNPLFVDLVDSIIEFRG